MTDVIASRDPHKPFDIFVGTWHGGATIFDRDGNQHAYWPSEVQLYWKDDEHTILRYQQHVDQLAEKLAAGSLDADAALGALKEKTGNLIEVDLHIKGKRGAGVSDDKNYYVQAQESAPGNYLFMLRDLRGGVLYCNNQFFVNPNLRQITGPTLFDATSIGPNEQPSCPRTPGLVQAVNIQTFTRVSYTVSSAQASPKIAPASQEELRKAMFLKAWVDEDFRKLLTSDRKTAVTSFAAELKDVPQEHVDQLINDDDCPPPACC